MHKQSACRSILHSESSIQRIARASCNLNSCWFLTIACVLGGNIALSPMLMSNRSPEFSSAELAQQLPS